MKIISIDIESHNKEDAYYTQYNRYMFVTYERSDEEIKEILNNIKPIYYLDMNSNCSDVYDIDFEDLQEQLIKYDIRLITSDLDYTFELEDEYKYE